MLPPAAGPALPHPPLELGPAADASARRQGVVPLARVILAHALALGIAADLLLRHGIMGLGYPLWLAIGALGALALVWRAGRSLPREAGAWLAASILFGAGLAWRDAARLQPLDFLASLFALGMAGIAIGDERLGLGAARLRDTLWAGAAVIRSMMAGLAPLVWRDVAIPIDGSEFRGRLAPALRAAAIAVPLLFVFGSLLRGADPVFASIVALPDLDVGEIASHGVVIGFFTWLGAGWARAALIEPLSTHRAPERLPFGLGMLDLTAALGTLNALFALYVVTQLGWFFGGERFLQARTGLTAAEYARQGFFQMVWVVVLVVPVLLVTRAALRPGRDLERRHTTLALPIIALLAVMIVSAMLRMRLYVQYYGLTIDRFYPLVFMGWLSVVLAWMALTVLRGEGRAFVAGAVVTGLATLAALNLSVPDVIVARVNVARVRQAAAGAAPRLDLEHLTRLGGEAVPLAIPAVLAAPTSASGSAERTAEDEARCQAANRLVARVLGSRRMPTAEEGDATWREWNLGRASARRAVQAELPALLAVRHESCPRPPHRAAAPTAPPVSGTAGR